MFLVLKVSFSPCEILSKFIQNQLKFLFNYFSVCIINRLCSHYNEKIAFSFILDADIEQILLPFGKK